MKIVESKFDEVRKEFKLEQEKCQQEMERRLTIMFEKQEDWIGKIKEECRKGVQEMEKSYKIMKMNMKEKDEKTEQEIARIDGQIRNHQQKIDQIEKYIKGQAGKKISEEQKREWDKMEQNLEREFEELRRHAGVQPQEVRYVSCSNNSNTRKFNRNINVLHPVIFIKYIKNKCKNQGNIELKQFVGENIEGDPAMWFIGKESKIVDMQTFENKFLKQFWGTYDQNLILQYIL